MEIPLYYKDLYLKYREIINATSLCRTSKERKLWAFAIFFAHMESKGITSPGAIAVKDVSEYVNLLSTKFAPSTMRALKTIFREILDWLHLEGETEFSGRDAFPLLRKDPRKKMLSYYTKDEVQRILESIENNTMRGKLSLCIVSLVAYLGIRSGDVANLKVTDIDWVNENISFIQQKTEVPLTLPLIDEVKYPLIDYLQSRNESLNPEYIFVTTHAPYTKISTSVVNSIVSTCIEKAGIKTEGRHHGPHALRHSLATNMLSENVPISAISNVLGHSSTKTTEIYLTVDETHLREIALEVPLHDE